MGHTLVLNADWTPISVLPISSLHWQDAVKALYLGSVQVMHEYENWTVRSPSRIINIPSVVRTRDYVKVRRTVAYSDSMIELRDDYTCQYCSNQFKPGRLTMDHVVPKSFGGKERFDNIVAACGPCNWRRGNNTRIQPKKQPYRPSYMEMANKCRKYPITVPSVHWAPYIGWSEELIRISQPNGEPGYEMISEPEKLVRALLNGGVNDL